MIIDLYEFENYSPSAPITVMTHSFVFFSDKALGKWTFNYIEPIVSLGCGDSSRDAHFLKAEYFWAEFLNIGECDLKMGF